MSIERCHLQKKDHYKERRSMMLARLWVNGLRSNVTPLELCKLDIVSIWNNPLRKMSHTHRDFFWFCHTTLI
jgi:hypothetical protein